MVFPSRPVRGSSTQPRRRDVIVIPKASSIAHVHENRAAADLELASAEIEALDRAFPRPRGRVALEML